MNPVQENATGSHARDEAGFTLIELVLAIGILGVVMIAIVSVMLTTLKVNQETQQRTDDSVDVQLATAYFTDDAYGAQSLAQGGTAGCGTTTPLIQFSGSTFTTDAAGTNTDTTFVVGYYLSGATLHRVSCSNGKTTPDSDHTLARDLVPGKATVDCYDKGNPNPTSCTAGTASVTLSIPESDGSTFQLAGTRRLS
ncbi:MAG TPA: prepilin-type N-terminal cleavage/methylation domain-containing protein [Kineosporiaceae bacterium]|nr:prepilin-type N-terminal cleavage/methylation domain-containing protein [Kineosporiaceae bacterium]